MPVCVSAAVYCCSIMCCVCLSTRSEKERLALRTVTDTRLKTLRLRERVRTVHTPRRPASIYHTHRETRYTERERPLEAHGTIQCMRRTASEWGYQLCGHSTLLQQTWTRWRDRKKRGRTRDTTRLDQVQPYDCAATIVFFFFFLPSLSSPLLSPFFLLPLSPKKGGGKLVCQCMRIDGSSCVHWCVVDEK